MLNKSEIPFLDTSHLAKSSSLGASDNNSCAVRAIATAFDVDYLIAFGILGNYGRKFKRGTSTDMIFKTVNDLCNTLGYEQQHFKPPFKMRATDIALANKDNAKAIVLMFTHRHITLLKDGKLHDTFIDTHFVTHFITLTKLNQEDMATDIKNLTKDERSKLVQELSSKITANTFTNTKDKANAQKLLVMLSRHKAIDEDIDTDKVVTPSFTLKF